MDSTTLIASLQEAVPGAQCQSVPTVDLQTTMYVSRDDVPAIARVLRCGLTTVSSTGAATNDGGDVPLTYSIGCVPVG